MPTEWEWQQAANGLPRLGADGASQFNHAGLRWHRPSPVGAFTADCSVDGVADLRGNVRQWCCSALDAMGVYQSCTEANASRRAAPGEPAAVRGSGYLQPVALCEPGRRQQQRPEDAADDLGLRLVLRQLPPRA